MRGNRRCRSPQLPGPRSIPAHAGEPVNSRYRSRVAWVYPRACGGTRNRRIRRARDTGLSPRMRGNPQPALAGVDLSGSIPAHAGEPSTLPIYPSPSRVYPRACGGTVPPLTHSAATSGLSPRMRGNRPDGPHRHTLERSIPAHAGEPSTFDRAVRLGQVYPRACGGTGFEMSGVALDRGLSPRMRGNLSASVQGQYAVGSIPAHAGEPDFLEQRKSAAKVYPRACGGTSTSVSVSPSSRGLSPRMRGNQRKQYHQRGRPGSIPAHAGEPRRIIGSPAETSVYPRACGGTPQARFRVAADRGLSPRMRGNLSSSS